MLDIEAGLRYLCMYPRRRFSKLVPGTVRCPCPSV